MSCVVYCRFFNGSQSGYRDTFFEKGKGHDGSERISGPLLSGISYCISSCSMILLNKVVLSSYNFDAGISLMLYQVIYYIDDVNLIWSLVI